MSTKYYPCLPPVIEVKIRTSESLGIVDVWAAGCDAKAGTIVVTDEEKAIAIGRMLITGDDEHGPLCHSSGGVLRIRPEAERAPVLYVDGHPSHPITPQDLLATADGVVRWDPAKGGTLEQVEAEAKAFRED